MRIGTGLLGLLLILGGAGETYAQGNSHTGRGGRGNAATQPGTTDIDIDITFGSEEIRLIRQWFGHGPNLEGLPPGLAKRGTLPPGLQRQLQRNGTLPPGLQSKVYHLPYDLEGRLPSKRAGLSRIVIGDSVILLEETTQLILDIVSLF